jgi:hypothetical protein
VRQLADAVVVVVWLTRNDPGRVSQRASGRLGPQIERICCKLRVWRRDFHLHHVEKGVSVRHYLKKVNKLFILFF